MTTLSTVLFYKTILRKTFLLKLALIKELSDNSSENLLSLKIIHSSNLYFKLAKSYPTARNESGFTLMELMVTITVLAIIITIAMPSILTQLAHMEAKRIKNQLTTVLATAKTESYTRRQNVLVCLSNAGGRCHRDSYKKLLLFVDNNDNQNFDAQTDYLLHEQFLNPKYSTLHLRVGANRHYTKFWGDSGKPRGHFGHIKYCPTATYNQHMYQISFNQGGIVKHKPNSTHDTGC
ncbi:GspH/FimT family pseudopilin [uncultured Psychrobacter sp.]|uniref:GspH/FimT family pseudopilin n=1 Tax=uncultured Psychrobacter sp. TaxID=259303 RepID=UPI00345A1C69